MIGKLKCAAKLNNAFDSVLKTLEDGTYLLYYSHETNILTEQGKLLAN